MSDETPKVKSADDMDAETFLKHVNARHMPIGGMTKFGRSSVPGDENEDLLRIYHARLHDSGYDRKDEPVNHTHGRAKQ